MHENTRRRSPASIAGIAMLTLIVAILVLTGAARATGPSHEGDLVVRLGGDQPLVASHEHDSDAGQWRFEVTATKQTRSVRISIREQTCATSGAEVYSSKVTDDELTNGVVARELALPAGTYCVTVSADGPTQTDASVTTRHPEPAAVEPADPVSTGVPPGCPEGPPKTDTYDPWFEYCGAPLPEGRDIKTWPWPTWARCTQNPSDRRDDPNDPADFRDGSFGIDHQVLAGALGPKPRAPFIYTKFYPHVLQVHRGDLVEWCFNSGYDWHSVAFYPGDMDALQHPQADESTHHDVWRWDHETREIAFAEEWLFAHDKGDETKACGNGYWHGLPPLEPCVVSSTEEVVGGRTWDRLISTNTFGGQFRAQIELGPGLYRYHCNIHTGMHGYIEVVPDDQPLQNPTIEQIGAEILEDTADAEELTEKLSDPTEAYQGKNTWRVYIGAKTADGDVTIQQYLPSRIQIRRGDRVRFIGGGEELNSVTFANPNLQGGFANGRRCHQHACDPPTSTSPPVGMHGMVGTAFKWGCDPDERNSGAPHLPMTYVLPHVSGRLLQRGVDLPPGCRIHGNRFGSLELYGQPFSTGAAHPVGDKAAQRAPGDIVLSPDGYHNSGVMFDAAVPKLYRTVPESTVNGITLPEVEFPSEFDAKFPRDGAYSYFCIAHEFMNGSVVVKP